MKEQRFILYMDILGTSQLSSGDSDNQLLDLIKRFSSYAREFKPDFKEVDDDPKIKYQINDISPTISNFSDHIVASYPSNYSSPPFESLLTSRVLFMQSLFHFAMQFHKMVLEKELLIRGAITEGDLYHVGNSILGGALNDSVALEERVSIYPRVILSDKLIDTIRKKTPDFINHPSLKKDFDGVYFVNYLCDRNFVGVGAPLVKSFVNLKNIIEKNLSFTCANKINEMSILIKWRWLANKFDESLDYFYKKDEEAKEGLLKIEKFSLAI